MTPLLLNLEERLFRGGTVRILFDANIILDALLWRDNGIPAADSLTFADAAVIKGYVCASTIGVICHHGAGKEAGRNQRERQVIAALMQFLEVLYLTNEVLDVAMEESYDALDFEDALVAAAARLSDIDIILTNDKKFLRENKFACKPQNLVTVLKSRLGSKVVWHVVRAADDMFRLELEDPDTKLRRMILPLPGIKTREEAERIAGFRQDG